MTASPLRQVLSDVAAETGRPMKDLTVLAAQNDPFRIDTPARHRDGEWLAITARDLGLGNRRIHLRGLHYMVIGRPKPDGSPYTNTDADWTWLQSDAGKAARWLQYIPFDQIVDQRNAAPTVQIFEPPEPEAYLTVGVQVDIPSVDDLMPAAELADFNGTQPYKLVAFGEKSSLADVLGPIVEQYRADLYLPTGEISDTLLYQMASIGAADGRPMVVLCFSDADPAGWQMPISIGRKLQAFKVSLFPDLEFQVHRVALTPDQVREYGLPSTPLKETEKRADRWRHEMGVEQTEIDALASLRPDLLREIARDAFEQFFDTTLDQRVFTAQGQWLHDAQRAIDEGMNAADLDRLRAMATAKLGQLQDEIDRLNSALRVTAEDFELPPMPGMPEPRISRQHAEPLIDSLWSFAEQTQRLIDSKSYRQNRAGIEPADLEGAA
ncbi:MULTISPECIES: hypothetical protein [Protofrankia]|uniref:hypothetical protein n=1 Tax=Protofrankia TaxID=2994361 RepID=UPI000A4E9069|nr:MULTISPECIES: hypothetical protein [Protofrankia]